MIKAFAVAAVSTGEKVTPVEIQNTIDGIARYLFYTLKGLSRAIFYVS